MCDNRNSLFPVSFMTSDYRCNKNIYYYRIIYVANKNEISLVCIKQVQKSVGHRFSE